MKKGKFYYGAPGVGKSTRLMAEFEASGRQLKTFKTAREVALIGNTKGLGGIANIVYHSSDLFIDDIGHEAITVNHFGTVFSPLSELIQAHYDAHQRDPQYKRCTYFTSNLTPEQLRVRYGDFIFDRLVEMCEWVHIEGESFRK
jgi:DNA replication protein DnaC